MASRELTVLRRRSIFAEHIPIGVGEHRHAEPMIIQPMDSIAMFEVSVLRWEKANLIKNVTEKNKNFVKH